jgi:hypothetical protein
VDDVAGSICLALIHGEFLQQVERHHGERGRQGVWENNVYVDPAVRPRAAGDGGRGERGGHRGRAVQVDPIKPTLKAPGTKRLKLYYDEPPSNFGFKCNLRHYTAAGVGASLLFAGVALLLGQVDVPGTA